MIDLKSEQLLTLKDVCDILPRRRRGRKPAFSTVWRWALHGIHGVRLETLKCGGTLCTSKEAVQRFFEQLSALDETPQPEQNPPLPTPARRQRELERVERELAKRGI